MELLPVLVVDYVVHASVDQLFLLVLEVLRDVVGDKHDAALAVDHKQKAVQGLTTGRKAIKEIHLEPTRPFLTPKKAPGVSVPKRTCRSSGPRWSLSMTP